ncbi:hypothetical protein L1049_024481 [Liquidambar formosana]|uniref:COI1 F-box domain-containing protein n=1 Tax=Liquidambar formosana TaxID=63359 RepID=A0AAP0RUZ8_LIQFO
MTTNTAAETAVHDLPDVILSNIFAAISDTRTRNAASLVCRKWLILERSTRTSLTLRGNARDLFMVPTCFRSVTHLDLSLLSPWGHPFLSSSSSDPHFLSLHLRRSFPSVTSLTVYVRTPSTLQLLAPLWPGLSHVKLVRWHQRLPSPLGEDFAPLLEQCQSLSSLDLSSFYHYTEDLPQALEGHSHVAANLSRLNLLTRSFSEGFNAHEIRAITAACPNLKELLVACMFDPRFNGFVGDEVLLDIASNCPKLSLLHLADTSSLPDMRGNPDYDESTAEQARITAATLIEVFSGLPLLEEVVLDVCKNVIDSAPAFEVITSRCPRLKSLTLGQFHGICAAIGSQLDGIALCRRLESLSIKNSADLTDMRLIAIARGCSKLAKFEVQGCKLITGRGIGTLACLLRKTLVEVKISCCKNLDAASSLRALEPVCDRIQKLHIDCIWDSHEQAANAERRGFIFDLNELGEEAGASSQPAGFMNFYDCDEPSKKKKQKCSSDMDFSYMQSNANGFWSKSWDRLRYLSLWIGVGQLITPLVTVGLENCPNLEEIRIKVEGDCKERSKPSERAFGLSSLACYPRLSKMQLDCSDTIGNALTAPSGQMDLSLWERFYLNDIGSLSLSELDYWPPQDPDINQRSLTLPSAGLLAECVTLRKLFIHGTAHEHFMMFLLRIPNLRDVQLREDYYPAPENDMSTEMRVGSCSRFEDALNSRLILD